MSDEVKLPGQILLNEIHDCLYKKYSDSDVQTFFNLVGYSGYLSNMYIPVVRELRDEFLQQGLVNTADSLDQYIDWLMKEYKAHDN